MTDPVAVERAVEGADAVLHAASVFSMDPGKAGEMGSVNVRGTDIVLGAAHRLGLDPIVYVSSELALLPPAGGEVLTVDSPVKQTSWPYCRSKADSELVARRYGLDPSKMPTSTIADSGMRRPGEVLGELRADVLDETGLAGPVQLTAVGSHDTASAVVGVILVWLVRGADGEGALHVLC